VTAAAVTGGIDVGAALARRTWMTSDWDDSGQLPWLKDQGIELVRGTARISGPRRVTVTGADGTVQDLSARRAVVLATGTRAALPPVPGLSAARPWDNRDVTAMTAVPDRLAVLGGGAVGLEMAQAVRRLGGTEVTVLEAADRLLIREEPFAGEEVRLALESEGITVLTGAVVQQVHRRDDGTVLLRLAGEAGEAGAPDRDLVADELLVAAGRRAATDDLGLDAVGLAPGRFVEVDDQLRAVGLDDGWLYAVGDCNGRALLTHMGKYQARIAGDVILGKPAVDRSSRDVVPRVTFTDPQVCAVGLTRAQAEERGITVRVVQYPTGGVAGAYTLGDGVQGTSQLVVDATREVVVGATFTGPGVAELLHSATVAIAGRVPLADLWHAVPSFPTVSEVWLRLLESYGL
jgi:dihydrolipoamide dehydrogenase